MYIYIHVFNVDIYIYTYTVCLNKMKLALQTFFLNCWEFFNNIGRYKQEQFPIYLADLTHTTNCFPF